MNIDVLAGILEMLDIDVDKSDSGKEAIEKLDVQRFDLVLTDDMMPGMSGTELMEYIKGNEQSASYTTPIVVITANAVVGAREDYLKKGFNDYMTKPIDIDVLQKILIKYLK